MKKKILLGCYSVPGSGGANTSGYKLFEMLGNNGFEVHYANIINSEHLDYFKYVFGPTFGNPKSLPNVTNLVLTRPLFDPDCFHGELAALNGDISPDLMIGIDFIAALLMKSSAPETPLIFLTAGCNQVLDAIAKRKTGDLVSFFESMPNGNGTTKRLHKNEFLTVRLSDLIITHSEANKALYDHFFPEAMEKIHPEVIWWADWICEDALGYRQLSKPFHQRDIDVIFVANRWNNRPEKNFDMVSKISKRFKSLGIHIVGEVDTKLPNAVHYGLVAERRKLFELLGRAKVIVCPSKIDAAPGILFEASVMGCNLVASRNCGNWQICNEALLVDPFCFEKFIAKISLAQTKKFDDNINLFLEKNCFSKLVDIISFF